ncbi:MAG: methionine--tRNA ligase [Spirochaetes bacterium]|nr:methionine--tRNA ligase [Spirochaetota bacterium]
MKNLITSALIYANGEVHLGHLVEYIQTDIFTRANNLAGIKSVYLSADDTHGAPIQIKAESLKITPEELINKAYIDHIETLSKFNINFGAYHSTNSEENREIANYIYKKLKENGYIYSKEIEITYCEKCQRFLPDRYIKGICPRCKAPDQYGDNCEHCNATYQPKDLIDSYCSICGNKPILKKSEQIFFKLSSFSEKLKEYIIRVTDPKDSFRNYLLNWINEGLKDWEISRDAPYFGFLIPDTKDKYFYVWFDAPIGYIGTTKKYCDDNNIDWKSIWIDGKADIYHFIGKDIIYHHFLFWPAILMGAGFSLPKKIIVHGFLTINNQKMSKSRGTFILARDYLNKNIPTDYLRAYYASLLGPYTNDFNYSDSDFINFINLTLIGKFGNLTYRATKFLETNFDSKTGEKYNPNIFDPLISYSNEIIECFLKLDNKRGIEIFFKCTDLINKYFQDNEPWNIIKIDKEKAHEILTTTISSINLLNKIISPVIPSISYQISELLNSNLNLFDEEFNEENKIKLNKFLLINHKINKTKLIFEKIEENFSLVTFSPITSLELRVGKIIEIDDHPDADKLYITKIKIGEKVKQIIAGLKNYYKKDELLNKKVIVLNNLKETNLRGKISEGMILACTSKDNNVGVLTVSDNIEDGELAIFEGIKYPEKFNIITFKDFEKFNIISSENGIFFEDLILKIKNENVKVDKNLTGKIS